MRTAIGSAWSAPAAGGPAARAIPAAFVPLDTARIRNTGWFLINLFLAFALALGYHVLPESSALDVVSYGLSLACLVIHCRLYEVWFRPTFWFLLAYVALFFVNPLVLAGVNLVAGGSSPVYPPEVVATYHVLTLAGVHLFVAGQAAASAFGRRGPPPRLLAHFVGKPERAVYFFFGLQFLACALFIVDQGGTRSLLTLSRVSLQLGRSPLSLSGIYLVYFSMPLFFLLPVFWKGRTGRLVLGLSLAFLVNVVAFLAFRIRTIFLATLVAMVAGWVFTGELSFLRRPWPFSLGTRKRKMLLAVVLLIAVALLGVTARFLRGQLEGEAASSVTAQNVGTFLYLSVQAGDFGYSPTVMELISLVPREQEYLYGQSYWRLALIVVPRTLFPEKPQNTERIVASWLMPKMEGMTIPPGIAGDLYINFGLCGIVGMFLWGCFFRALDYIGGLRGALFSCSAFPGIFHLTRGSFTNSLMILATIYFGAVLMERLLCSPRISGATHFFQIIAGRLRPGRILISGTDGNSSFPDQSV